MMRRRILDGRAGSSLLNRLYSSSPTQHHSSGHAAGKEKVIICLLVCSDDCDMAGTGDPEMKYIQDACHARWKVKEVSPRFMPRVRRMIRYKGDMWVVTLMQEEFIDGLVGTWSEELTAAGFANYNPYTILMHRYQYSGCTEG